MDEEVSRALRELTARTAELETWLALLVMAQGVRSEAGWRYEMTVEEAMYLRGLIPRCGDARVGISLDADQVFVLDVL